MGLSILKKDNRLKSSSRESENFFNNFGGKLNYCFIPVSSDDIDEPVNIYNSYTWDKRSMNLK